jgi:hypothetical protein
LAGQGYPRRPDAVTAPDNYKVWLDLVSRPMTRIPMHSVSRSDISHSRANVEAGTTSATSGNWSGYEARGAKGSYTGVEGEWNVPAVAFGEANSSTYSAFWVGIDGDGTNDLVQAGTEQDSVELLGYTFVFYHVWTELLPNQPTEQQVSLPIKAGDDMWVQVLAEHGFSDVCFYLWNKTQAQFTDGCTALNGTQIGGSEAEWIMERPTVSGSYSDLSAYLFATMSNAYAYPASGAPIPSGTAANRQLTMYNNNKALSIVIPVPPDSMFFQWINFH